MQTADFTIGWIAAQHFEQAAAIALLDEHFEPPEDFEPNHRDENEYVWGRMEKHHLVITCIAAGDFGTVDVATTATSMRASLPEIRVGLLVGVGSGVPGPRHDVRLGDVVVSEPDGEGRNGGVIQYDAVKAKANEKCLNGMLNMSPTALRSGLTKLRAQHELQPERVPDILAAMILQNPKMAQSFAGEPGYVHPGIDQDLGPSGCNPDREMRDTFEPKIHYGTIASGNLHIRDASERDMILTRLRDQTSSSRIICLDREAAGLMNSFPCLVIRGISDYADERSNDTWQRYAAATAAAFAKEFLSYMDPRKLQRSKTLGEVVKTLEHLHQDVQRIEASTDRLVQSRANTSESVQQLADVFEVNNLYQFLDPSEFLEMHQRARKEHVPGTGNWILEVDEYRNWKSTAITAPKCLWINGPPGSGKTVICSTIVEDMKNHIDSGTAALVCYYFDFANHKTQSAPEEAFLRASICQMICGQGLQTPSNLKTLCKRKQQPSTAELRSFAVELFEQKQHVFVIVDALDECPKESRNSHPRNEFLRGLQSLRIRAPQSSTLILSRPDLDMKEAMRVFTPTTIALGIEDTRNDIESYLDLELAGTNSENLKGLLPDTRALIKDNLLSRANGMFQWVVCMISVTKNLLNYNKSHIVEALNEFPPDLEQTYKRMLMLNDKTMSTTAAAKRATVKRALQWLAFSSEPLSLRMLYEVVSFGPNLHKWEEATDECVPRLVEPILRELSALVRTVAKVELERGRIRIEYSKDEEFVSLSHASVKDYLLSDRAGYFNLGDWQCHLLLAQSSFDFLAYASKTFTNDATASANELYTSRFLSYALQNAMEHQKTAEDSSNYLAGGINHSLSSIVASARTCQAALTDGNDLWEFVYGDAWLRYASLPKLHLLCRWGLPCSVSKYLKDNPDTYLDEIAVLKDTSDSIEVTALQCAVLSESSSTVKLLLERRADPNAARGALFAAARSGSGKMAQMLLDKGASVDLCGPKGDKTPLEIACWEGNLGVASLLLDAGARLTGSTALIAASRRGHQHIVRLLLDRGADFNARVAEEEEQTALQAAARGCYLPVIDMLLEAGFQAETPLRYEDRRGALAIVREEAEDMWENIPDPDDPWDMKNWCDRRDNMDRIGELLLADPSTVYQVKQ